MKTVKQRLDPKAITAHEKTPTSATLDNNHLLQDLTGSPE